MKGLICPTAPVLVVIYLLAVAHAQEAKEAWWSRLLLGTPATDVLLVSGMAIISFYGVHMLFGLSSACCALK